MTEQQLQDAIVEAARLVGWRVAHWRPARTTKGWRTACAYDAKGFPDLVLVKDRVIFAELKAARGALGDEQELWRTALATAGAEWHLWTPADWQDGSVDRVLGINPQPKEKAA